MLHSPLITRLYGPENYGITGTFMEIIGMIIPIAALTYPTVIVLPKSDKDAKGIVSLSLYITIAITKIDFLIKSLYPLIVQLSVCVVALNEYTFYNSKLIKKI